MARASQYSPKCLTRKEQSGLLIQFQVHQKTNESYLIQGSKLLELANKAHSLYLQQSPQQKSCLLRIVQSNCTWDGLTPCPIYKKPFGNNLPKGFCKFGSSGRARTCDNSVNSRTLYQLSYRGTNILLSLSGNHSLTAGFLQEPMKQIVSFCGCLGPVTK